MKKNIYALYKGDKFIDIGTKKELAETIGCKVNTISFLATGAYKRRIESRKKRGKGQNVLTLIKVDEEL